MSTAEAKTTHPETTGSDPSPPLPTIDGLKGRLAAEVSVARQRVQSLQTEAGVSIFGAGTADPDFRGRRQAN